MGKASKTFGQAYEKLTNDHSVLVTIERKPGTGPCTGAGGCTSFDGNVGGQATFSVTYDPNGIVGENFLYPGTDVFTTLGHGIVGHVGPGTDAKAGLKCAYDSCAVPQENKVRRDLGRPDRPLPKP